MKAVAILACLMLLVWLGNSALPLQRNAPNGEIVPPVTKAVVPTQANVTAAAAQKPFRFTLVAPEQGLSNTAVWSVLRDRYGFMWFGTLDGLARFDGYKVKFFTSSLADPTSLSENKIRTLYEDHAGNLWIGTWSGGLDRFERETETFKRYLNAPEEPDTLSNNSVFAIHADKAGTLWIGTRGGGLNQFEPATGDFSHFRHDPDQPASLANDNIFAILPDDDGGLWLATDGGLDHFDPVTGTFRHYRHHADDPASLSSDAVRALYKDKGGALWVGTLGGGLDRFDLQSGAFAHFRHTQGDPSSLSSDLVLSIHQDSSGALWVGTIGGGANRLDPSSGKFLRFEPNGADPGSFGAREAYDIVEDAGLLWFGTNHGVSMLNLAAKPFQVIKHDPGNGNSLTDSEINSVYVEPQGILWVATANTGLNRIDRATGEVTRYRYDPASSNGIGSDEIWSIAPARDGGLWLATYGSGLDKFDPATGRATHYRHDPNDPTSLASDQTTSVREDASGIVWIGTWDEGLERFDPKSASFTHFPHVEDDPNSLSDNTVLSLSEDRNATLWIGTATGGVNRFDAATATFTHFQAGSDRQGGLASNTVNAVYLDRAGIYWVATWGGGFARLDPATRTAVNYDRSSGLPSDSVYAILEDSQGRLWLSTSKGLSRFEPRTKTFRNYDQYDGLPSDSFEASVAAQSPNGEMFFGTSSGLVAFYPDQIQDNLAVPPVVLIDFLLANKPVAIGGDSALRQSIDVTNKLALSYEDRVVSFEFSALDYATPQKNRYRYQLEGFDREWVEVGSDRRLVTYTNLDPGNYVFRVLGSNADGIWNTEGVALALTITPPWWQTLWFRTSALLLVLGVVAGGLVWQQHRALVLQRTLEAMVVDRTRELQDTRHQVSTLFDNSPSGIIVTQLSGEVLAVNRAIQRITGYTEDELLQSNARSLYAHVEQRDQLLGELDAAGFVADFGIELRRRDGSLFFASLSLSWLEMGGQRVVLGITEDVTDQVEARAALASLHEVSYDLATIPNRRKLLERSLQHLYTLVDYRRAFAVVKEGDEPYALQIQYTPVAIPALAVAHVTVNRWPYADGFLGKPETTYVQDVQASDAVQAELVAVQNERFAAALQASRSWLRLPLISGGHVIGVLDLLHEVAHGYTALDIELARTFANHLAVALENIHLNDQARHVAAADERARIARDLHDSVTQTLFTASVLAEAAPRIWDKDREVALHNMGNLSQLLRSALVEMRSLLLELRMGTQPQQPLDQLLLSLADVVRARGNIAVEVHVVGDPNLPTNVTLALYRIAQEALNNVIKHAEATNVVITMLPKTDCVELRIKDDGRGFDPQRITAGNMGISIMGERIREIGGSLHIQSEVGGGTEVIARWQQPIGEDS